MAVRGALSRVVDLAAEQEADLLLIAGDLFHRQPLQKDLREVSFHLATIPNVRVVIIAGNHDHLSETSAWQEHEWPRNVTFLSSSEMSSVYFADINTEVHGLSYHRTEITRPLYDDLKAPRDGRIHILLAHGGDAFHSPISYTKLAASGFDYIALGHIHQPKVFKGTHMAFAGSPEPLNKTELGLHGCFSGEISPDGFTLRWHTLAENEYKEMAVPANVGMTQAELEDLVRFGLAKDPKAIFTVKITGRHDADFSFDTEAVSLLGRIVDVKDLSEPDYNLDSLLTEHSNDLISHYIQALNTEDATPRMKKALYYGLRVLLKP